MTGKAFRHELKRLFSSMAIKMRLSKDPKPADRRPTAIHINYSPGDVECEQRRIFIKDQHQPRRASTGTMHCLRCRLSSDSTVSNASVKTQRNVLVRPRPNDVTYCLQRISNV